MQRGRYAHVLGFLASLVLLLGIALPILALMQRTLQADALTLLASADVWRLTATSAGQALASTLLATLLGIPAAWALAQSRLPLRRFWRALFVVPFVLPSLVAATAVLAWVGPRGVLGLDLRDSWWVIVLAHAFYNVGVIARIVGGHLHGAAPRLLEAAAALGASPWRRFWRVTLPTARPAIIGAAALVFLFCFTSFGVILVLAPNPMFATLEVEVYRRIARTFDLSGASALALLQLTLVLLIAQPYLRLQAATARAVERSTQTARGALDHPAIALLMVLPAALLVLLPLAALAHVTLSPPAGASMASAWASITAPSRLVGLSDLPTALGNSLRFGVLSMLVALTLGTALAVAIERGGWRILDTLSVLPWAISAITLGLGLLLVAPTLAASPWGVPVAHALLATPLVTRVMVAALASMPGRTREAAATLGASPWRSLWRLELPMARAALASAAAFAFAASLGEFGAALLLRRPETTTLPVAIAERLGRPGAGAYAEALLLASILALLVAASVLLIDRMGSRSARGQDPF